jgi:hypothetical protein
VFADGVNNIVEAQQYAAEAYFADGSIDDACPPLRALLHVMVHGHYQGKDISHPELRSLFTRQALLESDWYAQRLQTKQARDVSLWQRHVHSLSEFLALASHRDEAERLGIGERLAHARAELERVSAPSYLLEIQGTIGADPLCRSLPETVRAAKGARERLPGAAAFSN